MATIHGLNRRRLAKLKVRGPRWNVIQRSAAVRKVVRSQIRARLTPKPLMPIELLLVLVAQDAEWSVT